MNNKFSLLLAAALIVLSSCEKSWIPHPAGEISIDASIGGTITRVQNNGNNSIFTASDQIMVFAWTGSATSVPDAKVVDGVVNTFDGTVWTPSSPMLWKPGEDAHYFLGIYTVPLPLVQGQAGQSQNFTSMPVKLDPNRDMDILVATNFGSSGEGVKPSGGAVPLAFDHVMARLDVNLRFRSEWGTTPKVSGVTVKARDMGTINLLTKEVTATNTATDVELSVTASVPSGYSLGYSGLQLPQAGVREVSVMVDGKDYVYRSGTDIPLQSGRYTTLGLVVGKDKIELNTVSVSDWTAGAALPDGDAELVVTTGTLNGHDWVDLGLPSGLKWATCNVGASKPEDYGDYFAWGETEPYYEAGHAYDNPCNYWKSGKNPGYAWDSYKWCSGSYNNLTKYNNDGSYGTVDNKTVLESEDDAAGKLWGGPWRMPTDDEWTELRENCTWTWTTLNSVNGRMVTGPNGGSIFLSAAGKRVGPNLRYAGSDGYYWSSSLNTGYPGSAWRVGFNSGDFSREYYFGRYEGFPVRPVSE